MTSTTALVPADLVPSDAERKDIVAKANLEKYKQLSPKQKKEVLNGLLRIASPTIANLLPKQTGFARMYRIYEVVLNNPGLLECAPRSVISSIVKGAEVGLEIGTALHHAALVPFRNKGVKEAQIIFEYPGLLDLAQRSGKINFIEARIVYANDVFEIDYSKTPQFTHKPALSGDRGEILGAYALARKTRKIDQAPIEPLFEWMTIGEVFAIRDNSPAYKAAVKYNQKDAPWIAHPGQQIRKTLIRRISNYVPKSSELAMALELDDTAYRAESQYDPHCDPLGDLPPDMAVEPEEPATRTEQVKNELKNGNGKKKTISDSGVTFNADRVRANIQDIIKTNAIHPEVFQHWMEETLKVKSLDDVADSMIGKVEKMLLDAGDILATMAPGETLPQE